MHLPIPPTMSRLVSRYGPWAIVTGASSGIGREMARQLAADGMDLVLVARSTAALEELAAELTRTHNTRVLPLSIDLQQPTATAELAAATAHLDVGLYVANAGFGTAGPFLEASLDEELAMLAVNCSVVLSTSLVFGRRFAERGRGGIVLVSSILAFSGVPNQAHYAATKAYVQSLAEGIAPELASRGVDVLVSAPGPTQSGFADRAGLRMGRAMEPADVARDTLRALGRKRTVHPGFLTKVLSYSLLPVPRWGRVRILGLVSRGMTKHRRAARA